jgi:hypothetical protein
MSKCPGLHCPGCGPGSGGTGGSSIAGAGAVVLAVAVAVAVVSKAVHAALGWLAVAWPWLAAGGSLTLAGGVSLLILAARRRARVAVSWQLGRTALRAPQRPAPGPGAVIPGVVIRPALDGSRARRRGRELPGRSAAPARPAAPAWPRTRPDGSREAR